MAGKLCLWFKQYSSYPIFELFVLFKDISYHSNLIILDMFWIRYTFSLWWRTTFNKIYITIQCVSDLVVLLVVLLYKLFSFSYSPRYIDNRFMKFVTNNLRISSIIPLLETENDFIFICSYLLHRPTATEQQNEIFPNYGIRHLKKHQSLERSLLLAIETIQTQHKH
jgi:hypothetical protein